MTGVSSLTNGLHIAMTASSLLAVKKSSSDACASLSSIAAGNRLKDCTNATASASRAFCAEHATLFTMLAAANKADQLRARIDTLRTKISTSTTADTQTKRQVGLQIAADSFGADKQVVATILMAAIAIAMEVCDLVGWSIAAGRGGQPPVKAKLSGAGANAPADASPKRTRRASAKPAKRSPSKVSGTEAKQASVSRPNDRPTDGVSLPNNVTPPKPRNPGPTDRVATSSTDGVTDGVRSINTDGPKASLNHPSAALAIRPSEEVETDDPVASFVTSQLTSVADARMPACQMQQAFTEWCERHQIEPVSCTQFARDLKRLGVRKTRGGANGSRVYHDVALS